MNDWFDAWLVDPDGRVTMTKMIPLGSGRYRALGHREDYHEGDGLWYRSRKAAAFRAMQFARARQQEAIDALNAATQRLGQLIQEAFL